MDPATLAMLVSAGVNLAGNFMGGDQDNGANAANQHLQQISKMGKETLDPYMQGGHQAQNTASNQYNKMANGPMDFLNQIISGYKPSEGYKFREKNALNAARNSAAAGGFSGTHNDQMNQAELSNGLLGQDMQEWLQNVLGIQSTGLSGLENQAHRGLEGARSLADLLGNVGGAQAGLARSSGREQNQNQNQMMGQLSSLLGQGAGALAKKGEQPSGMIGGTPTMRNPSQGGFPFKNANAGAATGGGIYGGWRG